MPIKAIRHRPARPAHQGQDRLTAKTCHLTPKQAKVSAARWASFPESDDLAHPFVPIGRQIEEAGRIHLGMSKSEARARAIELLSFVGIPDPEDCYDYYPHQFSGGMKQRIMIAAAVICQPDLLIADEATTALDVTVQKEVLDLLQTIQQGVRCR